MFGSSEVVDEEKPVQPRNEKILRDTGRGEGEAIGVSEGDASVG